MIISKIKSQKSNIKNNRFVIIFIIVIAFVFRIWNLNNIPPHLTPDEAALGYNAYSILKTARDEHGVLLPIIFKSFGDYKPGLYVYLTIPFILLFGLNELSVRLPSALTGVFTVWLLYLIVKKLKKEDLEGKFKVSSLDTGNWKLEIVASFLLAVSPWHIHFSRGAWEANLSLTLTLAGIYFFLKIRDNFKSLIASSVFFSLTLLAYQGAKLSTTIVVLVLIIVFWKSFWKKALQQFKILLISVGVGILIISPILLSFIYGKVGRLEVYSIFSYPRKVDELSNFLGQGNEKVGGLTYYIFHSESYNFVRAILGRWFNHFSGRFLFFEGDWSNPRHSAPNHGVLLISDLLLLILGFVKLFKTKSKFTNFIFIWLILSPLPAVLSRNEVHAIRSLNMVIPLTLVVALGVVCFVNILNTLLYKWKNSAFIISAILVFLYLGSLIYFIDAYFIHLPKHDSKNWEYGFKQMVETVSAIQGNYKTIKIQQSFSQPYIYFLFFQNYDPVKYQAQEHLVESEYKGDVGYVEGLDNICFCAIDWPQNKKEHGTLVVADPIRIPDIELKSDAIKLIKEIKYLNNDVAFRIVEIK